MQLRITAFLYVLLLPVWTMAAGPPQDAFFLVRDNRPAATVVYAGDHAALQAAVEDLAGYVQQITGAELQVSRGVDDTPGPTLHIGTTSLDSRMSTLEDGIELDGFAVKRVGEDLIIAGKIPEDGLPEITSVDDENGDDEDSDGLV